MYIHIHIFIYTYIYIYIYMYIHIYIYFYVSMHFGEQLCFITLQYVMDNLIVSIDQ